MEDKKEQKLDWRQSIANGNEGIRRAYHSVEKKCPGWTQAAVLCVRMFPKATFLIEEPRVWAYKMGLLVPEDQRAWGYVTQVLKKDGTISLIGFDQRQHEDAHADNANKWEKVLTGDEWYGEAPDLPIHNVPIIDPAKIKKRKYNKFRVRTEAVKGGVWVDIDPDEPYSECITVAVTRKDGDLERFETIIQPWEKTTLGQALDHSLDKLFPKPEPKKRKKKVEEIEI